MEMLWSQIENVTRDVEAFARHAGRGTVNTKDVVLLGRRTEDLGELLRREAREVEEREGRKR